MIKAKVKTKASTLEAKAWAFEAKADAIGPEAKTIKFSLKALEAKAWPRGLHHCYNMCQGGLYDRCYLSLID